MITCRLLVIDFLMVTKLLDLVTSDERQDDCTTRNGMYINNKCVHCPPNNSPRQSTVYSDWKFETKIDLCLAKIILTRDTYRSVIAACFDPQGPGEFVKYIPLPTSQDFNDIIRDKHTATTWLHLEEIGSNHSCGQSQSALNPSPALRLCAYLKNHTTGAVYGTGVDARGSAGNYVNWGSSGPPPPTIGNTNPQQCVIMDSAGNWQLADCSQKIAFGVCAAVPVVDGGWSSWDAWTLCTNYVCLGLRQRNRVCNNPPPTQHPTTTSLRNGADCSGFEEELKHPPSSTLVPPSNPAPPSNPSNPAPPSNPSNPAPPSNLSNPAPSLPPTPTPRSACKGTDRPLGPWKPLAISLGGGLLGVIITVWGLFIFMTLKMKPIPLTVESRKRASRKSKKSDKSRKRSDKSRKRSDKSRKRSDKSRKRSSNKTSSEDESSSSSENSGSSYSKSSYSKSSEYSQSVYSEGSSGSRSTKSSGRSTRHGSGPGKVKDFSGLLQALEKKKATETQQYGRKKT